MTSISSIRNSTPIARISCLVGARFVTTYTVINYTHILGYAYCVQAVGEISTYPGYSGTVMPTTSGTYTTASTLVWSDLPAATPAVYQNITTTTVTYPLATGSLSGCFKMFENDYGNIRCYEAA